MSIRKGDKAKAFALATKPGEVVDLNDYLGKQKIVLLFFPLAFSPVCTVEMCTLRDAWSDWERLDARIFGISVDSPFVTEKFRELERIPFPILSDFNKEVARSYDVLHEELLGLKGVCKRSVFVIDEEGTVVYDWVSEDPKNQIPFDEIKAALGAPAAAGA